MGEIALNGNAQQPTDGQKFPRRSDVRMPGITLCMCLVMIYGINVSRPGLLDRVGQLKGVDFLQFYTAGAFALRAPTAALYDQSAFADLSRRLVPESRDVY